MSTLTAPRSADATSVYLARLPILDSSHARFGYELVWRPAGGPLRQDPVTVGHAEMALVELLAEVGLTDVTGTTPAFVKVSTDFLHSGRYRLLPADLVYLVLDVRHCLDDGIGLMDVLTTARRAGYVFGIDGITPTTAGIATRMDFARIDLMANGVRPAIELAAEMKRPGLQLCLTGLETMEQFEACKDHFELFQGTHYRRPSQPVAAPSSGESIRTDRLASMQLLAECSNPDATLETFEMIIGRDPGLTFRVLQLANSGFAGLPRRLESLRDALITVGVNNVRNLAMIASLNRMEDHAPELISTVVVRAKLAELIAKSANVKPAMAFTAGLLSLVDTFVGLPLSEAAEKLALADDLKAAILYHSGPIGHVLATSIAFTDGEFAQLPESAATNTDLTSSYLSALTWARDITNMHR